MNSLKERECYILLTHQKSGEEDLLTKELEARELCFIHLPLVEQRSVERGQLVDKLKVIKKDDTLVFTSKNGVRAFTEQREFRSEGNEVYAIGEKTAELAQAAGLNVTFVGSGKSSQAFAKEILARADLVSGRLVLLRGDKASNDLPTALLSSGLQVEKITAYQSDKVELADDDKEELREWMLIEEDSRIAVFTSPLAVSAYYDCASELNLIEAAIAGEIAVIGETTESRAKELKFSNISRAKMPSIASLAELVVKETS